VPTGISVCYAVTSSVVGPNLAFWAKGQSEKRCWNASAYFYKWMYAHLTHLYVLIASNLQVVGQFTQYQDSSFLYSVQLSLGQKVFFH